MKIENYSFGSIRIDGKEYRSDLIVYPDHIDDKWWRKEGHLLQMEDMTKAFSCKPEILIVGQGLPGLLKVDVKVEEYCRNQKIDLISLPTMDAVNKYNELANKKPLVIAALHLTC
ncbi:MAG: MTH938/NDUFAF3 family protein [bacterium]|nr:MTH938/NDUFAF3 family protein [bacterium]